MIDSSVKEKSIMKPPVKTKDARSRKYLTPEEVMLVKEAAKKTGRNGQRDWLLITMAYRHAYRIGEIVDLQWDAIDFNRGVIYVSRSKGSKDCMHYLESDELRALKEIHRHSASRYVFCSENKLPMATRTAHGIIQRAGRVAGLPFDIHPHMLRHAKGFQLAMNGTDTRAIQDYMGHKSITHTLLYTELNPTRFKGFGADR